MLVAASRLDPASTVRTQGQVLTLADLLSTLVVETAVHCWATTCAACRC